MLMNSEVKYAFDCRIMYYYDDDDDFVFAEDDDDDDDDFVEGAVH